MPASHLPHAQLHRLAASGWTPDQASTLERALAVAARERPSAPLCLDFDNTCIDGDVGESLHIALCEARAYALEGPFWDQIDPRDGRDALLELYMRSRERPDDRTLARLLSNELIAVFLRRLRRVGVERCYAWAATLHAGMRPSEVAHAALEMFERERLRPRAIEVRHAADGLQLRLNRGITPRAELIALFEAARGAGLPAWVVTATNIWAARAVAPQVLGIDPRYVIGNACVVRDDVITKEREGPTTYGQGKLDAIAAYAGEVPAIAAGDSWNDVPMLEAATHLAILIDRGDRQLRAHALQHGWMVVARPRRRPRT